MARLHGIGKQDLPAVINIVETIMSSLFLPRKTESSHKQTHAPIMIAMPPGKISQANGCGIMAVDIESLSRPKHEIGEEVGSGDEGDQEGKRQDARVLLESLREHGEFGAVCFPKQEGDDEDGTEDERRKDMGRTPGILLVLILRIKQGSFSTCIPDSHPIACQP